MLKLIKFFVYLQSVSVIGLSLFLGCEMLLSHVVIIIAYSRYMIISTENKEFFLWG